ncbi:MAG: hypothetical protein HYW34_02390 [Candidatus Brennerbacteria bacterium]|nr:hypothetical protein [Candidatus Brennerbacteria bacterium]
MSFKLLVAFGVLIISLKIFDQIKKSRRKKILIMRRRFENIFNFEAPKPCFKKRNLIHQLIKDFIESDLRTLADILLDQQSEMGKLTDVIKQKALLGADYIQYIKAELELETDENSELKAEINEKLLLCAFFKIPVHKDIWDYSWDKIIKKVQTCQISKQDSPNL